jgi:hypothetical protein
MKRQLVMLGLLFTSVVYGQSVPDAVQIQGVGSNPTNPKVAEQCGMFLDTPDLKSISDQTIGFGCTGSYKNGEKAVMDMDFQYDPNFNPHGGDNISFVVEGVNVDKKISDRRGSIFQLNPDGGHPNLSPKVAHKESNCGDPVFKTTISPITGENWHGWIAEESFSKAHGRCAPAKEYTSRYRCIHVIVGNNKMSAQLDGVCLLRKREYSLENGFSYDLFFNMLKTLRFIEN